MGISVSIIEETSVTPRVTFNQDCITAYERAGLEKYTVVVGAGLSSPYITPVSQLRESLSKACGVADSNEELWVFCKKAHDANATEYYRVLRKSYEETPYWDSRVYKLVSRDPAGRVRRIRGVCKTLITNEHFLTTTGAKRRWPEAKALSTAESTEKNSESSVLFVSDHLRFAPVVVHWFRNPVAKTYSR